MAHARRDARTRLTEDLSVIVRRGGRSPLVARVLNVSEGGMLIGANDLCIGEIVKVELVGPRVRFACRAEVAHRTGGASGLHVLSWEGPAGRALGAFVAARLAGARVADRDALGFYAATVRGRDAPVESRQHERRMVAMLSALITSPTGDRTRHDVLDVSEYGLLIDGLAFPVGVRIGFLLEDLPFVYAGRGHIVHRTGSAEGVAVDEWQGAPEAIHELVVSSSR